MPGSFRVALGGLFHETNQYVQGPTMLEHFDVARRDRVFKARMAEGRTFIGGMMAAVRELGADAVGTLYAVAEPWGTIAADAYCSLKRDLLDELRAALPVDAVAFDIHGAAVAEDVEDVEGDLCAAVRELIGPDVVFVVTHDLHGHISQREVDAVDAMFAVHEYPHDDMFDRGREAIGWAARQLDHQRRPAIHVERLPLLMPMTTTYHGAGADALDICLELEGQEDVIDVAFMHGFPYSDNPHVGAGVIAVVDGPADRAESVAREAARAIWALRAQFRADYAEPRDAVRQALATPGSPIVINETSDNPGCGAPGDGTHLLSALLDARPDGAVFCGIRDPEAVRQAQGAGVGATIDVRLGGKTDDISGDPLELSAYVKALTDGETVLEAPTGRGWRYPLGPTALMLIEGVEVIVFSLNVQTIDRTPLLLHGIDPSARKLVALKSSQHFRSGFEKIAAAIITTDAPGQSTAKVASLPRSRSPRPIFPLDADAHYD